MTELTEPTRPTPGVRRWVVLGAVGATLVTALIGYVVSRQDPSRGDSPTGTPLRAAAPDRVDAPSVDAAPGSGADRPPDAPSRSGGSPPGGCPAGMVRVPAGTFRMGDPKGVGDLPQHEVTLSAYCIDRTEVTVKAYAACVAAKECSPAPRTVQWSEYSAENVQRYSRLCNRGDRPDHPINCVDWNQAAAYCTWAGKRLPTEAEWEYAARGTEGRVYPWGNEAPSATRLNACGLECVAMARRELNMHWTSMYDASDGWETTAPVGSFPEGASPYGALDMAGNVSEWTADWYGAYPGAAATNSHGAETGTLRVIRGGDWDNVGAAFVRAAVRDGGEPSDRRHIVGFRCARGD